MKKEGEDGARYLLHLWMAGRLRWKSSGMLDDVLDDDKEDLFFAGSSLLFKKSKSFLVAFIQTLSFTFSCFL